MIYSSAGPACAQIETDRWDGYVTGFSENCLTLNIYTSKECRQVIIIFFVYDLESRTLIIGVIWDGKWLSHFSPMLPVQSWSTFTEGLSSTAQPYTIPMIRLLWIIRRKVGRLQLLSQVISQLSKAELISITIWPKTSKKSFIFRCNHGHDRISCWGVRSDGTGRWECATGESGYSW